MDKSTTLTAQELVDIINQRIELARDMLTPGRTYRDALHELVLHIGSAERSKARDDERDSMDTKAEPTNEEQWAATAAQAIRDLLQPHALLARASLVQSLVDLVLADRARGYSEGWADHASHVPNTSLAVLRLMAAQGLSERTGMLADLSVIMEAEFKRGHTEGWADGHGTGESVPNVLLEDAEAKGFQAGVRSEHARLEVGLLEVLEASTDPTADSPSLIGKEWPFPVVGDSANGPHDAQ